MSKKEVSAVRFEPHAYQQYCIKRLITDTECGLLLDMGLGKTVITLTAINDLKYNRFQVNKTLVIAPKKVAEATWQVEAGKWEHLKHLRMSAVLGPPQKRVRALNRVADIYIINRENVAWIVKYYQNAWPFDCVVIDELSSFKNSAAVRFKALSWVRPHIKRIIGLTGTPAPNGLIDLWAQIYLLDEGKRLEEKFTWYREKYFEADQRSRDRVFSYAPKPGAEEEIYRRISDLCISLKAEDYIDLPDKMINDIPVVLDAKAQKAYDELEKTMLLEVEEDTIDAGSAAVLTGKLLQLCNGAEYVVKFVEDSDRVKKEVVEIHDCKLEAFAELVEQLQGRSALVFYTFKHDIDRIRRTLKSTGKRIRLLDGPSAAEEWNRGEVDILLAHPASCAYGLNLQAGGSHIIWFGLNWSLELYQQANARLHRQGQQKPVIIHRLLVVGGVDEDVAEALENKCATQDKLLDALKARIERVKSTT